MRVRHNVSVRAYVHRPPRLRHKLANRENGEPRAIIGAVFEVLGEDRETVAVGRESRSNRSERLVGGVRYMLGSAGGIVPDHGLQCRMV